MYRFIVSREVTNLGEFRIQIPCLNQLHYAQADIFSDDFLDDNVYVLEMSIL